MSDVVKIFDELKQLHLKKDHDYSGGGDKHLANFEESERIGIGAYLGAFIRLQDKYVRCCNLISGMDAQVEEKLEDTLQDLAVYACIVLALYRKANGQGQVNIKEKYNQIVEDWRERLKQPKKDPVDG